MVIILLFANLFRLNCVLLDSFCALKSFCAHLHVPKNFTCIMSRSNIISIIFCSSCFSLLLFILSIKMSAEHISNIFIMNAWLCFNLGSCPVCYITKKEKKRKCSSWPLTLIYAHMLNMSFA